MDNFAKKKQNKNLKYVKNTARKLVDYLSSKPALKAATRQAPCFSIARKQVEDTYVITHLMQAGSEIDYLIVLLELASIIHIELKDIQNLCAFGAKSVIGAYFFKVSLRWCLGFKIWGSGWCLAGAYFLTKSEAQWCL